MKIKTANIVNFKNIRSAEVHFGEGITKVSGKNGAGKSSIYDAIWTALLGKEYVGKGTSAEKLITKGETKAEITIKLTSSEKTIKVKRKINESGEMYLEAVDSEANKLTQKEINALCSIYAIDPLDFTRLSKKDQFELVQKATGLNTKDLDDERVTVYAKRTEANSIFKNYKGQIEALGEVKKVDRVNTYELTTSLELDMEHNQAIKQKQDQVTAGDAYIVAIGNDIESFKQQIKDIQAKIEEKESLRNAAAKKVFDIQEELKELEIIDISRKQYDISMAEETNALAQKWDSYVELKEKCKVAETKAIELDNRIKAIDEEKNQRTKEANMPIENMEISESDGIIIDGLPFSQYSTAQQIIMACRIATATNPEIKLIGIKDGSLLDDDTIIKLEQFADECGYQFYLERVGEEVDGLVIRDGEVQVNYLADNN